MRITEKSVLYYMARILVDTMLVLLLLMVLIYIAFFINSIFSDNETLNHGLISFSYKAELGNLKGMKKDETKLLNSLNNKFNKFADFKSIIVNFDIKKKLNFMNSLLLILLGLPYFVSGFIFLFSLHKMFTNFLEMKFINIVNSKYLKTCGYIIYASYVYYKIYPYLYKKIIFYELLHIKEIVYTFKLSFSLSSTVFYTMLIFLIGFLFIIAGNTIEQAALDEKNNIQGSSS